jgi:hypothetical protein
MACWVEDKEKTIYFELVRQICGAWSANFLDFARILTILDISTAIGELQGSPWIPEGLHKGVMIALHRKTHKLCNATARINKSSGNDR